MKKTMLQTISALLALILLLPLVFSCGDNAAKEIDKNEGAPTDGAQAAEGGENATEEKILPELPESDFGGHVFTVLSHREDSDDWYEPVPREITAEVENAEEPINDAVYRRNQLLKERYNIDFAVVDINDEKSQLNKIVKAGEDIYDAVIIFNNNVPTVVQSGNLLSISSLPYVDMDKPWWDSGVNAMSISGKNYLLAGDLLILDNEATNALLFNKDLMAALGMELPYNLAKDGKWTMDKLNNLLKQGALDLDGDGQMTPEEDRWGFVTFNDTLHALLVSGGGALALKDENDLPYMSFAEPRNLQVIEMAMEIMYNKPDVLNIQSDINTPGTANENWFRAYHGSFEENRALFIWVRMRVVEKFRGMDANFGILPMPKFDEAQNNYASLVNPYTGVMLGVPKTVGDPERTSIILEAMAAESKYTLQPAYYDIVLQRKFARDEESSEMLDIIFGTRTYDIGGVYSFGNVFMDFIALCNKSDTNIMSYYEKKIGSMNKAIEKVVAVFEEMD
ncbi:MAG: extracellular solute-binding protein [Oscillospiraceae bacterium]|nr:extracellular solute-binding protein [Oscillospiraceae bacterium]